MATIAIGCKFIQELITFPLDTIELTEDTIKFPEDFYRELRELGEFFSDYHQPAVLGAGPGDP